jgi:hypothetical protein
VLERVKATDVTLIFIVESEIENEFKVIGKEAIAVYLMFYPNICLVRLMKTTKTG